MYKNSFLFPFTKKKFLTLKKETQHKWVIKWLGQIYQKLITNRIDNPNILLFSSNYQLVLKWMGISSKTAPTSDKFRAWVEFVSDAIHYHRQEALISPKDHDLLNNSEATKVSINDISKSNIKTINYHIAIDSFRSLFNIGAIYRICDAAGFRSIILGNTPGKEHASVQKTSMGAYKWVKSEKTEDLASTLIKKKNNGYSIIGIETIKDSIEYNNFTWPKKAVIVLGNEEYGISRHVLKICDSFVHIPMYGNKNSINVANAASVIMFHVATKKIS